MGIVSDGSIECRLVMEALTSPETSKNFASIGE
jgi:hypothetical protein